MHNKKLKNILSFPAAKRYSYFIGKVCDFEEIWGLHADGWAMASSDSGEKAIPFWPEKDFAEVCANGSWRGYSPKVIKLEDFANKWIPGMAKDGCILAIFPTPEDKGILINPDKVLKDLEEEFSQY